MIYFAHRNGWPIIIIMSSMVLFEWEMEQKKIYMYFIHFQRRCCRWCVKLWPIKFYLARKVSAAGCYCIRSSLPFSFRETLPFVAVGCYQIFVSSSIRVWCIFVLICNGTYLETDFPFRLFI